jgi:BLOC-1 related complex subunit 6
LPPQLDSNVLSDLEIEANYLAANIDNLTENLANLLHSISSITADNVEVYKNSVTKLTDTIDSNIKSMYSIIAKSEEISKSMHKAEQMAARIREIRRLVDMFEAAL